MGAKPYFLRMLLGKMLKSVCRLEEQGKQGEIHSVPSPAKYREKGM
jgi:hypothetical protein